MPEDEEELSESEDDADQRQEEPIEDRRKMWAKANERRKAARARGRGADLTQLLDMPAAPKNKQDVVRALWKLVAYATVPSSGLSACAKTLIDTLDEQALPAPEPAKGTNKIALARVRVESEPEELEQPRELTEEDEIDPTVAAYRAKEEARYAQ